MGVEWDVLFEWCDCRDVSDVRVLRQPERVTVPHVGENVFLLLHFGAKNIFATLRLEPQGLLKQLSFGNLFSLCGGGR